MAALTPTYLIGHASTPGFAETRDFLSRNRMPFRWVDIDGDPLVRLLSGGRVLDGARLPLLLFADGSTLEGPERYMRNRFVRAMRGDAPPLVSREDQRAHVATARFREQLAAKVGLPTRPEHELYDVLILGAGPAGTSARIENYPGFPEGIGGAELAESIHQQAVRLGAEILIGVELTSAGPADDGTLALDLSSEVPVRARAGIAATGVHYRRLEAPGVDELIGAGVHYGSAPSEAAVYSGRDVVVVGGANAAGQAALHLADFARRVTVVCRAASLDRAMSRYLVERIGANDRIAVRSSSNVTEARGEGALEEILIADEARGEEVTVRADGLFVLIGAQPVTAGVEGWLRRDEHGFLVTGSDLLEDGEHGRWWPLERDPLLLEASQPGVFVAGDIRHGSIKRVASAVGEGAMAAALVHRYLAHQQAGS